MNTPSPLVPQGTKPSRNRSTIRIAFFTILIVHVVFIGGLLIQGCTRDNPPADGTTPAPKTNADATLSATGDLAATPTIDTTTPGPIATTPTSGVIPTTGTVPTTVAATTTQTVAP